MIVYLVSNGEYTKIGISGNFPNRLANLQTANASKLTTVGLFDTDIAPQIEGMLHRIYDSRRVLGEWFSLNSTEIAAITELLRMIDRVEILPIPTAHPVSDIVIYQDVSVDGGAVSCPICGSLYSVRRADQTTCGKSKCRKGLMKMRKSPEQLNVVSIEA